MADWALCVELMVKATHLDPTFALAYRRQGVCYMKTSDPKKAYCAYKRYLELDPAAPEAGRLRACMKDMREEGKIDCPKAG